MVARPLAANYDFDRDSHGTDHRSQLRQHPGNCDGHGSGGQFTTTTTTIITGTDSGGVPNPSQVTTRNKPALVPATGSEAWWQ